MEFNLSENFVISEDQIGSPEKSVVFKTKKKNLSYSTKEWLQQILATSDKRIRWNSDLIPSDSMLYT